MFLIFNGVSQGRKTLSPLASTTGARGIYVSATTWDTAKVAINWSIDGGITWTPLQANSGSTAIALSDISANGNWTIATLNGVLLQAVVSTAGSSTNLNVGVF